MAAVFLLFKYTMYTGLGGNVATAIFVAIAAMLCVTLVMFIRHGRKLREMSLFAQADESGNERDKETGVGEEEGTVGRGQRDSSASTGTLLSPSKWLLETLPLYLTKSP